MGFVLWVDIEIGLKLCQWVEVSGSLRLNLDYFKEVFSDK